MALTKDQLVKIGVPESVCDAVIAASTADTKASIDGHYVPKEKFDSVLDKNKDYEKQVADRDAQIVKLGAMSGDAEKFKAEAEKAAAENKAQKEQFDKEMADKDKRLALRMSLAQDGCVDPAEVSLKFDLEQIIVDKAGSIVGGYENQRDVLKSEKAYYFNAAAATATAGKGEVAKPAAGLPAGWMPVGQTPPSGSDTETLTGPEAEAIRMVQNMTSVIKSSADISGRAQSHYFGSTPAPAAEIK